MRFSSMGMGVTIYQNKRSCVSPVREGVRRYTEAHTANFTMLQLALRTLASLSTVYAEDELMLSTRVGFLYGAVEVRFVKKDQ